MKTYSDEDILRYVDGDMEEVAASKLGAEIENDPTLSQRVDAMLASKLPYSMAYKLNPPPPIPDNVKQSINTWTEVARNAPKYPRKPPLRGWKVASLVAAISASFALGYLASNLSNSRDTLEQNKVAEGLSNEDAKWVQRVADYQSLYVPETVGHIEDGERRAIQLLNQLASRNDLENTIPDLSSFGYQFVRAQQLGFNDQPLVQLVYLSPGKKPLALCFMPSKGNDQHTVLVERYENLSTANWRSTTQRYVIVADEPVEHIQSIAAHAQETFL